MSEVSRESLRDRLGSEIFRYYGEDGLEEASFTLDPTHVEWIIAQVLLGLPPKPEVITGKFEGGFAHGRLFGQMEGRYQAIKEIEAALQKEQKGE